MPDDVSAKITLSDKVALPEFFGAHDEHLRLEEKALGVRVVARGSTLDVKGDPAGVEKASKVLGLLAAAVEQGRHIDRQQVEEAAAAADEGRDEDARVLTSEPVLTTHRGRQIRPRSEGQRRYVAAMASADLVLAVGPAGTGKTYLAVAAACAALRDKTMDRVILTRPAVEAGEKLGFLPGDMREKVDPYLRPLNDALHEMLGAERVAKAVERGTIEVAPLAYMRGRTLNDAFVILDEAQNTTIEQMKMFLTRMGFGSKVVATGDITQTDLPRGTVCGLVDAMRILEGTPGVEAVSLGQADVVRHPLVRRIISSYEASERSRGDRGGARD